MQEFYKYHGAGNDFILIDNRKNDFVINNQKIGNLCNRRLGIGADGLILLNSSPISSVDFKMQYFNSDGFEGTMCGNGGRCIVAFANRLGIIDKQTTFEGIDGLHKANIISSDRNKMEIRLQMKDVQKIHLYDDGYFLDTGSPHIIRFVKDVHSMNVFEEGKAIRNKSEANINFVQIDDSTIFVRTFERGVEDETLSCGTGVVASALVIAKTQNLPSPIHIQTQGGKFEVSFDFENNSFSNIWLQGETCFVFKGFLE
jgi:diaminopimelate epimerase